MRCQLVRDNSESVGSKQRLRCARCKYSLLVSDHWNPDSLQRECRRGVGAELTHLIAATDQVTYFAGIQLKPTAGCGCTNYATQLDAWGPEECRRRQEEIIDHLSDAASHVMLPAVVKRFGAATLLAAAIIAAES